MPLVTDIRERRRVTHERLRRQLALRSFPYATVAEVDETFRCNGRCEAKVVLGVRVVVADTRCPVHASGGGGA